MKKPHLVAVLCTVCALLAGLYFVLINKDNAFESKSSVDSTNTTQEVKNAIALSDQNSPLVISENQPAKSTDDVPQEENIDYAALPLSDNAPESDTLESSDEVEVRIDFAQAGNVTDNALYAVVAHDGGILENGAPSGLLRLDELRELAFRFYASPNNGTHRVTITSQSGETQKLDFWVGEEVTFAQE